jgi:glutamate carboxypeptidase
MKFAIASYIHILKELGDTLPQYDIGVMIPGDEETGGFNGVKKLLDEDGYRGEAVFLPDGGGAWQFEEAAKGMWAFELVATGKSVHSSRPWEGESATKTMSQVLNELYKVAEDFWLDAPEHWHLTCNVGLMSGGQAVNQVADEARVAVDIRATTETERRDFEERIDAIVAKYPTVTRTNKWNEAPYGISRDFLLSQSFARIAKEYHAIECGWTKSHGSSDARHFAQFGIPSVLIWPVAGGAHSEAEWIDLADFERFHAVTKDWVKEVSAIAPAQIAFTVSANA